MAAAVRPDLRAALNLTLFATAIYAIDRVLRDYALRDVIAALGGLPIPVLIVSVLLTLAGYAALVGYDWVAFRQVAFPQPYRHMVVPSFVSYAVANIGGRSR